jgi:hypothetical protein
VVLFGVGGLALLVSPALAGTAGGRYSVPMAGPMLAASAVVLVDLAGRVRARRRPATAPRR